MTIRSERNYAQKLKRLAAMGGFLLLSLGVSAGVMTGTTSWASGVSVGSESMALTSTDLSDYSAYPVTFDASIENALTELRNADPAAGDTISRFYATYTGATQDYGTALLSAAQLFAQNSDTDPAGAKNAYIDTFSNARATYFGELESARNAVVTDLSGQNDVAKDMFVNEYNAARDLYNNQLEGIKNEIASLNP